MGCQWNRFVLKAVRPRSRKEIAKDPMQRAQQFEKEFSQLLHIWQSSPHLDDCDAADSAEIRIRGLNDMLRDESQRRLPHPCIQFSASKQIYKPIAKIALQSRNVSIIRVAVYFFGTLIESEEPLVGNPQFAASLTKFLVQITNSASKLRLDEDTKTKVVEIAFNITTKIRSDPQTLSAWFSGGSSSKQDATSAARHAFRLPAEQFAGKTQKEVFPLVYLLLDHIPKDGKIGDFARTGLLYTLETASTSVELEKWIVESDLSTLMATSLGALYSQLSRKLVIDHPHDSLPPVLAFSDYQHPETTPEIESSCSYQFKVHMGTFLSHLLFWQDVLNHCRSVAVKKTLLEHFQLLFLQQVLYPTLLESSDIDGGSSVAVLTYLRRILEALDHPDMINLILHYLLGLPDSEAIDEPLEKDPVEVARKRKSMDLRTLMAQGSTLDKNPQLFNLVDMVLACLRSRNQQTIHVTLQLVSVLLKRHHRYAVITLLQTESIGRDTRRTVGAHKQEVELIMSLAGVIGGLDHFDEMYDSILRDTMSRIESHPCAVKLLLPKLAMNNFELPAIPDSLPGAPSDVQQHTLNPNDRLLNTVIDILSTFFVNPVETNLSVTETVIDLAICGYMSLEGWFSCDPRKYVFDEDDEGPMSAKAKDEAENRESHDKDGNEDVDDDDDDDDDDDNDNDNEGDPAYRDEEIAQRALKASRRRPKLITHELPRLLQTIQTLVDGVATYKETIPRFEDLLQQRREAFHTADAVSSNPSPLRKARGSPAFSTSATTTDESLLDVGASARPTGIAGFAQLLDLGTPRRASSPRHNHRPQQPHPFGTPVKREGTPVHGAGYGFATPTAARTRPVRHGLRDNDLAYENARGNTPPGPDQVRLQRVYASAVGSTSSTGMSVASTDDPFDGISPASSVMISQQKTAFTAVDQSILNRKIALPRRRNVEEKNESNTAMNETPTQLDRAEMASEPQARDSHDDTPTVPPAPTGPISLIDLALRESRKNSVTVSSTTFTSRMTNDDGSTINADTSTVTSANERDDDEHEHTQRDGRRRKTGGEATRWQAEREEQCEQTVTVSHVITNVLVLQSFLMELASVLQVRAGLFDEVRFV